MCAQTRPRFILSSEGVLGEMEFEPMLTPREKSPLPEMSPEEDRTRDAVDSEPKHYQLSYSGPRSGVRIPLAPWGFFSGSSQTSDLKNCLVGLVVRRRPRERKIPGSNPVCAGIFSGSSHSSGSKIGTPVATLPGFWRYRVSAGTG